MLKHFKTKLILLKQNVDPVPTNILSFTLNIIWLQKSKKGGVQTAFMLPLNTHYIMFPLDSRPINMGLKTTS